MTSQPYQILSILTSVFLQNNTDLFRMFIARIKPPLNQSPFPFQETKEKQTLKIKQLFQELSKVLR